MAVTFPIEMPTEGFSVARFRLVPVSTRNRLRSGATFGTTIGAAYWSISVTSWPMHKFEQGKWLAFLDVLRGNVKPMLLYNPGREYPAAYKNFIGMVRAGTSTPFTGRCALSSISATSVGLNQLPANFILARGDLLGLVQNGRYSLHRIVEDSVANGSGATTVFQVEPPIPISFFTTAAAVDLYRPKVEAILDDGSISGDEETAEPKPISFSATSRAY